MAAENAKAKEILDALIDQLSNAHLSAPSAYEDLVAFLESIPFSQDQRTGEVTTMLDRVVPIAKNRNETLAKLALRMFDPRLVEPGVYENVRGLLAYIRADLDAQGTRPASS